MALKHRRPLLAAVFLSCCAAMALLHARLRDERIIRGKIADLIARCEKRPGTGVFRTLTSAADLRAFFATDAILDLGGPYPARLEARELPPLLARAHMELERLQITLNGIEFLPREAADRMDTRLAAELTVRRGGTEERHLDEYRLRWRKVDGDWKIAGAESDSSIQSAW